MDLRISRMDAFPSAVDRCAFWLAKTVGKHEATTSSKNSRPKVIFASLPRHDLRGILLILAAPKVGRQVKNEDSDYHVDATADMKKDDWSQPFGEIDDMLKALAGMDCDTFLRPNPCSSTVEGVLQQRSLRCFDMPAPEAWLSTHHDPAAAPYPHYLPEDPVQAEQQPIAFFQTSGSTGDPKPVIVRVGAASIHGNYGKLPILGQQPTICDHMAGQRVLSTFGWYQYGGFVFHVIFAVYFDYITITAPLIHDWSSESIEAAIIHGNIQSCITYPAAFVEFCLEENQNRLPTLRHLKSFVYGGSSIPFWVGNTISQYTRIGQFIGATEVSVFPQELPRRKEDWQYLRLHPQAGVQFRPYTAVEGAYRMVVVRQEELRDWQPVFVNFPDLQEYEMGDLVTQHATDPDLWLSVGRIVDLFTLPDGRLLNPVPIEHDIAESPDVLLAIICGLSPKGALVILLTPRSHLAEDENPSEVVERVWPAIERSFATKGPAWISTLLDKFGVMITPPGSPIQRTGAKWNVNRKKTLVLHRDRPEKVFGAMILSSGGA